MSTVLDLVRQRPRLMLILDEAGHARAQNSPLRPPAPRFAGTRTAAGHCWVLRYDLPSGVAAELDAWCRREPVGDPARPRRHYRQLVDTLGQHAPVTRAFCGPCFVCRERPVPPAQVTRITSANAAALTGEFRRLKPVLPQVQPVFGVVRDGRVVAVCHSARLSRTAAEAGVDTHVDFRRRGYGAAVTRAWIAAIMDSGRAALYSTAWENAASRGIARRLGLEFYGEDTAIF